MPRRSHEDALGVAGAETVIGTGVTVIGTLESESDINIDGQFDGTIKTQGNVTLGVNAKVTASITGTNVTVAGHLKGNIKAEGEASIRETGQVEGDIHSSGLSITPGGVFVGRNYMQTVPELAPADPDPAPTKGEPKEPDAK